jgi:hypothetical protein
MALRGKTMNETKILETLRELGTLLVKVGYCRESKRLARELLSHSKDSDSAIVSWHKTIHESKKLLARDVVAEVVRTYQQSDRTTANGERLLGLVETLSSSKTPTGPKKPKGDKNADFERAIRLRNTIQNNEQMRWLDVLTHTQKKSKNERFSKEKITKSSVSRFKTRVSRYAKDNNLELKKDFRRIKKTNKNQ